MVALPPGSKAGRREATSTGRFADSSPALFNDPTTSPAPHETQRTRLIKALPAGTGGRGWGLTLVEPDGSRRQLDGLWPYRFAALDHAVRIAGPLNALVAP